MSGIRITKLLATATLVAGVAASLQGCILALGAAAGGGALVATDRRTVGSQTEDREIQVKALAQLHSDLPDDSHVNVSVFNQRVLMTGEVPDEQSKQKADAIVRNITNVGSVANELAVQPSVDFSSRTNDSYLEGRVKTALIAEKGISANNFKVVSERGIVYLMGLVTVDEGNRGADAASRVPGVMQVVKVFQYIQPEDVAAANAAASASGASGAAASAQPPAADEPTVGAVPDSSVTSQPLQQQAPAPVVNSTTVHPAGASQ
ncbi:BON domain-containing protein [Paraburkholderia phosphatilytica]|uniref:BON domain-containing protein n=1 Tax=Paraburkholderia phosphatilytica TaxID=2282883 RepID=UPI000E514305|nr:BON domain-containing protein [Paraburkholderia phosphatilytica]